MKPAHPHHIHRIGIYRVRFFLGRHPAPPYVAVPDLFDALKVPKDDRQAFLAQPVRMVVNPTLSPVYTAEGEILAAPVPVARAFIRAVVDGDDPDLGEAAETVDTEFEHALDVAINKIREPERGEVQAQLFLDLLGAVSPSFAASFTEGAEGPLTMMPVEEMARRMGVKETLIPSAEGVSSTYTPEAKPKGRRPRPSKRVRDRKARQRLARGPGSATQ